MSDAPLLLEARGARLAIDGRPSFSVHSTAPWRVSGSWSLATRGRFCRF